MRSLFVSFNLLVLLSLAGPARSAEVDFVRDIRPIFQQYCVKCHGDKKQQGGLRFDFRADAVRDGESGKTSIMPGQPDNSELVRRITSQDNDTRMPPEGDRLGVKQIDLLRQWIQEGAKWPEDAGAAAGGRREMVVTDEDRRHWSYRPLHHVELPAVKNADGVRTPVDSFVLAKLEAAGIPPSPPIESAKLIRRVFFDVVGLPPELKAGGGRLTEERLGIELESSSTTRLSQPEFNLIVDRLLESPHYGERWGRHWLDVARYADSDGQETDRDRPQAYQYRDFVIRALNDDMPFDQFVRWQLAGNEYEPDNPAAVAATGFLTAGPFAALGNNLMEDERLRNRYNELDDIVSTIGTGLLGLTFACARCHDHKYDAVPARDYYRILSALHCGDRAEVTVGPSKEKLLAYRDAGPEPKPSWLFRRGDYYDHDVPVTLGFLTVLTRDRTPEDYWREAREKSTVKDSTLQRRALADWMTDVDHGAGALVARVIVNRVWQHHFGNGLVRTVGDFGVRSETPSHPELLEWLARDLVQNGWKLKRLHRLILTSATYQQAGAVHAVPSADPDNRLLWKMNPQRLEAEILRDAMLAVSGTLNLQAYGPGFKPPIAAEAMLARNIKDPYPKDVKDSAEVRRRSVYMFHKRVIPNPLLQAFDKPDAQQSCNRRDPTTVAPQALALLNDQFVRTTALDFAERLLKDAGSEPAQCVERGYQLAVCRAPNDTERIASLAFLETQIKERTSRDSKTPADEARRRALADWCQILFSLNEFLYID
jgi:mono/diheme cytochrome c family protein